MSIQLGLFKTLNFFRALSKREVLKTLMEICRVFTDRVAVVFVFFKYFVAKTFEVCIINVTFH